MPCPEEAQMGRQRWRESLDSCAALAEAPFDHAKKAMFSSRATMIGTNLLYVPFAALMLVMYDKAAYNVVTRHLDKSAMK